MVLDHFVVEIHTEKLAKSIADRMWQCEDSPIVQMGTLFEPNELWVLGSVINGYDSGQKGDAIRAYIELEIQKLVDSMPKLIKNIFETWDSEHEDELLITNIIYSKICKIADDGWLPPDEWGEDKYWWSFKHPLDEAVKKMHATIDYENARNMFITDVIAVAREQFKELSKYSVRVLHLVIQCKEIDCYAPEQYSTKAEIFDLLLGHVLDEYLEEYF